MTRDETAYREATRDPIFLFQQRRYVLTGDPSDKGLRWDGDDVGDGDGWLVDDAADPVSWAELERMELARHYWDTERVYLSREEAERYGQARAYNYPEGWRVYCVPCEGELAKILKEHAP